MGQLTPQMQFWIRQQAFQIARHGYGPFEHTQLQQAISKKVPRHPKPSVDAVAASLLTSLTFAEAMLLRGTLNLSMNKIEDVVKALKGSVCIVAARAAGEVEAVLTDFFKVQATLVGDITGGVASAVGDVANAAKSTWDDVSNFIGSIF